MLVVIYIRRKLVSPAKLTRTNNFNFMLLLEYLRVLWNSSRLIMYGIVLQNLWVGVLNLHGYIHCIINPKFIFVVLNSKLWWKIGFLELRIFNHMAEVNICPKKKNEILSRFQWDTYESYGYKSSCTPTKWGHRDKNIDM
jgi:hypothetical protein